MDKKIADIQAKLEKEHKVLDAAQRMLHVSADQGLCKTNIHESLARIHYLEGEMRKITGNSEELINQSVFSPDKTMPALKDHRQSLLGGLLEKLVFKGSKDSLSSPDPLLNIASDSMEFLLYGNALTSDQLLFRLSHIAKKIEVEKRVKSGTENLLAVLKGKKEADDLALKIDESISKIQLLTKANSKYADLNLYTVKEEEETTFLDSKDRKTGRIKFKIVGAANLASRKSQKDEIQAKIKVDGCLIYTSRLSKSRWDENLDLQVDRAGEIEIFVVDKAGNILSLIWFHLSDLVLHLDKKYGTDRVGLDMEESWIDLEPSGQLCLKMNFEDSKKTLGSLNGLFRRDAVIKVYPKNGHQFVAQQFYQVMTCALCSEFLGGASYQCQSCKYLIHANCYNRVVTKCVDLNNKALSKEEQNTGQLLKYNIPHRWSVGTSLSAHWCAHCGGMVPPTRKIHRCTECSKVSHIECAPMIPAFCGLAPAMADQLVAAFEEHERKIHAKELEDAENERKLQISEDGDLGPERGFTLSKDLLKKIQSDREVHPVPGANALYLNNDISLDDFSLHSVLGRGAFGKVLLVSEKKTGGYFALKALKKDFIVKNDDIGSINIEKSVFQISSSSRHPFLVNLHSCFHSPTRIFFVMEYVPGGDLMTHIQEVRRFTQLRTKFYACEVLLALEYLHMNKVIYRDLKLDNILLCSDGHIKVADYGICKNNIAYGDLTSTFCGTPDYMAVELLLNKKYGLAVDWWSFGILIYVMLIGKYPYRGEDENQILDAILSDNIDFPPNMPKTTLSLIQSLLNKNPARRLGGGIEDANEVRRHPYFSGVDWNALFSKVLDPPFVPTIGNVEDVSNFDRTFTCEDPVLTPLNTTLGNAEQAEFSNFAFVSDWAIKTRTAS